MKNLIDFLLETKINIVLDLDNEFIDEANQLIYKPKAKDEKSKYPITIQIGDHGKERQTRHIDINSETFDKNGKKIQTRWIINAIKGAIKDIQKMYDDGKIKEEKPQEITRTNKYTSKKETITTIPSFIITDTRKSQNNPLNVALYIEKYHINSHVFDLVVKTVLLGDNFRKGKNQQQILLY